MKIPQADDLQVCLLRTRQLHRDVSFHSEHVGRRHATAEIDAQTWVPALELDDTRDEPCRA
ncbi:hypothetical protein QR78_10630 [Methylobacterium indicum]|nr:hypothetical protein QR78_10630 [Methylobacterium indicum]